MHPHSFLVLAGILAGPTFCSPSRQPLALTDVTLVPLIGRDLDAAQDISWSKKNEVLFNVTIEDLSHGASNIEVFCSDCEVSSAIQVVADVDLNIIKDVDATLTVKFAETSAHIDVNISTTGNVVYSINLFTLESPLGIEDPAGTWSFGIVPSLDLEFDISGEVELAGGIELTIPNDSFIKFDLKGDIVEQNFEGTTGTQIPWKVNSGSATVKTDLRLRVQAGVDLKLVDVTAAVGVYANLIEIVADIARDPSASCPLEVTESWNVNAGAYVDLDVNVGFDDDSLGPTTSKIFFTGPTFSQCLDSSDATTLPELDPSTVEVSTTCTLYDGTATSVGADDDRLVTTSSTGSETTQVNTLATSTRPNISCSNSTTTVPPSQYTSTVFTTIVDTVTTYFTPEEEHSPSSVPVVVITKTVYTTV
ncbi:Fc.00g023850.m01.CDS01 [Cosmosporella sp. VM-42]